MNNSTYQNIIIHLFRRFKHGKLCLQTPDGSLHTFGDTTSDTAIHVTVNHPDFFKRVVLQQDIGLGESFILNQWQCDDVTGFLKLLVQNQKYLNNGKGKFIASIARSFLLNLERIKHRLRSNSKSQSRENISAHYDLSNELYSQFLDPSMTYSSAYFSRPNQSLTDAQHEKYDRICRKLALKPKHHLLEIGSGWGGFAIHAAQNYGCKITTITISQRQFDFAKARIKQLGLDHLIKIEFKDYRDIEGQFDRIASVEMLEAVGHEHLQHYFNQCSKLLTPEGLLCLQVILSPDSRYHNYRKSVDYIRKHIFPGGHLPSLESIQGSIHKHSDWDMLHYETFGTHYAETLRRWNTAFDKTKEQRRKIGFDEAFDRKWKFYFQFCEAGFDMRHIQVAQLVFGSPNNTEYQFEDDVMQTQTSLNANSEAA